MVELNVSLATPLIKDDKIFDPFLNVLLNMTSWQLFSNLYYQIKYFITLAVLHQSEQ